MSTVRSLSRLVAASALCLTAVACGGGGGTTASETDGTIAPDTGAPTDGTGLPTVAPTDAPTGAPTDGPAGAAITDCAQTDPSATVGPGWTLSDGAYVNADGGFLCGWNPPDDSPYANLSMTHNPSVTREEGAAGVLQVAGHEDNNLYVERDILDVGVVVVYGPKSDSSFHASAVATSGPGHVRVSLDPRTTDAVTHDELATIAEALFLRLLSHF